MQADDEVGEVEVAVVGMGSEDFDKAREVRRVEEGDDEVVDGGVEVGEKGDEVGVIVVGEVKESIDEAVAVVIVVEGIEDPDEEGMFVVGGEVKENADEVRVVDVVVEGVEEGDEDDAVLVVEAGDGVDEFLKGWIYFNFFYFL
ncbi:hypothetical protein AGMMS49950_04390 [Endomicrobiia bacterium]|nr:hypothetical protein AGMMS49950_04390 [Endomicrobiia bacterium]